MPTTEQRGLGWSHQKRRKQLLPAAYGKACAYCGCVMLRGMVLDLDHVQPRALGGTGGDCRIVHAACNRRAGAHLRNFLYNKRRRW